MNELIRLVIGFLKDVLIAASLAVLILGSGLLVLFCLVVRGDVVLVPDPTVNFCRAAGTA